MNSVNTIFMSQIIPFFKFTWSSLEFWRFLSFGLLTLILAFFIFKDSLRAWLLQASRIKHDKELFQLLDLLMPERKLLDFLEKLEKENAYEINSLQFIDKFRASLKEQTRQFLTSKIKKTSLNCMENLDNLRKFMDDNFIMFPNTEENSTAGLMYPNPKIDGGGNENQKDLEKFTSFTSELKGLITGVRKNYQKYRAMIKEIIQI